MAKKFAAPDNADASQTITARVGDWHGETHAWMRIQDPDEGGAAGQCKAVAKWVLGKKA